jgi:hypothetical protein
MRTYVERGHIYSIAGQEEERGRINIGTITRDMIDWQMFSLLALLVESTNTGTKVQILTLRAAFCAETRDMMDWQPLHASFTCFTGTKYEY